MQTNGNDDSNSRRTSLLITILSMTFTVISILLSIFEYALSKQIDQHGSAMIIKFPIESKMIADMSFEKFNNTFVYSNKYSIRYLISKTLFVNQKQVEHLIPVHSSNGTVFTLIIVCDSMHFDRLFQEMKKAVQDENFISKLTKIYKITDQCSIPLDKFGKWVIGSNVNENDNLNDDDMNRQLVRYGSNSSHMIKNVTQDDDSDDDSKSAQI